MRSEKRQQDLQAALGTPKYYLDAPGKKAGEQYFWFPTQGDSMTNNTAYSIPSGSLVLGRLLTVTIVQEIPLNQPIVVIIRDGSQQVCMLKSACAINEEKAEFCLHSYNTRYNDFWLPFGCVQFVFEVELVRLASGEEFII